MQGGDENKGLIYVVPAVSETIREYFPKTEFAEDYLDKRVQQCLENIGNVQYFVYLTTPAEKAFAVICWHEYYRCTLQELVDYLDGFFKLPNIEEFCCSDAIMRRYWDRVLVSVAPTVQKNPGINSFSCYLGMQCFAKYLKMQKVGSDSGVSYLEVAVACGNFSAALHWFNEKFIKKIAVAGVVCPNLDDLLERKVLPALEILVDVHRTPGYLLLAVAHLFASYYQQRQMPYQNAQLFLAARQKREEQCYTHYESALLWYEIAKKLHEHSEYSQLFEKTALFGRDFFPEFCGFFFGVDAVKSTAYTWNNILSLLQKEIEHRGRCSFPCVEAAKLRDIEHRADEFVQNVMSKSTSAGVAAASCADSAYCAKPH